MTPYLAVIQDSFREAMSSRVLWVLLLFTTLLLALIAPIGVDQQLAWELRAYDLLDAQALAAILYEARDSDDETPQARLWRLLNDSARQRVGDLALGTRVGGRELFGKSRQLADDLNVTLARRDFYHELAYQQVALRPETERWLRQKEGDLSETQLARRNRLLLEDAFPGTILAVPRQSVALKWGPWSYPRARPIGEDQLKMFVEATVAAFMNFFVGIVGVFVAVLVTAPMVPRMFDSGSLYLLLSKPVSRTLIYLSKFVGACIFILINASYLIVGLYLVVGLRFDVWNPRLLLAIPIFLFLFAVYFSVTALASLVWKNAIVSIAVTILFWLGCLTVDWVKTGVEALFINPPRTERIVAAGDQLFRQDHTSAVYRWDETLDDWQEVFLKEGEQPGGNWFRRNRPQRIGPVYDGRREQLLAVESDWSPFNALGVKGELWVAAPRRGWNRVAWSESPGAVYALHERPDAGPLAVGSQGVSAVNTDIKPDGQATELLGFKLPFGRRETSFVPYSVTPPLVIQPPLASAYDGTNGRLFLWVNQSLLRLEPDGGERLDIAQQEPYAENESALLLAA
ncbi:MAG: ABC transporter permease, partial [Pirellulales bacterium]